MAGLTAENAVFAIIAFEGPDEYSRSGGLAVRVRDLSEALAAKGFATHLFFVGDPRLPAVEVRGNLTLHRWSQWVSAYHPGGVYEGEWGKLGDMAGSLPTALINQVVWPAAQQGKVTVVMGEDWQVARTMINIGNLLAEAGLTGHVIPAWTANNLYGFWNVDFPRLRQAAAIMTVSKYMKHQMIAYGVDPLVAPNGITPAAIVNVSPARRNRVRVAFGGDVALFKIGRFSPDKRWMMAMDAAGILKRAGAHVRILIRGDRSPYGNEVLAYARYQGLTTTNLNDRYNTVEELAAGIAAHPDDVLNLTSFLPDAVLPVIYSAADAVLANSGFEPFGLVGLEVMGAGGLAVVGSTGEEYAEPQRNAVVLDTDDPREIAVQLRRLSQAPEEVKRLKRAGKETARAYVWPEALRELFAKLEYVAFTRGVEVSG